MKTIKVSPIEAELYLRRVQSQMKIRLAKALAETLRETREFAVQMSSGDVKEDELRRMGHPYAKRHYRNGKWGSRRNDAPAIPFGDAAIINDQTGQFRGGWKTEGPNTSPSGGLMGRVYNDTKHASLIEAAGNPDSKQIKRPIEAAVKKVAEPLFEAKVREAVVGAIENP